MSQTAAAAREPLLRIAKREGTTMPQKIAVRAIAIILALVVDAVFIFFVTGLNPLAVYGVMWRHLRQHDPLQLDAARSVYAALRRHCAGPRVQDALLELRR